MRNLIMTTEGEIMKLRALGYSQNEISNRLGITQSAVSQRLGLIRRRAESEDMDRLFWSLLLGAGAAWLFIKLLESIEKE